MIMENYVSVKISELRRRMVDILTDAGVSDEDSHILADTLLEAEIEGRESHGLMRFAPLYKRITNGKVNRNPQVAFREVGSALYHVDGDNGLGAVLANQIMSFCQTKAKENGLCVAFVNNANHLGAAGYYTARAADDGFFALVATNGGPAVAPWGGVSKLLGTNPFSCSFPAGKYKNFTLDVATSASAMGKIIMYAKEGRELPLGWAMDHAGKDTTSAQEATSAFSDGIGILPMAAHKGTGIAMIIDLLAGILPGAKLSKDVSDMFSSGVSGVGYFYFVLDIERFMPRDVFEGLVEEWFDTIKEDKKRPGVNEILIPGEIENRRIYGKHDNIEVFRGSLDELEQIEKSIGLK